MSWAAESVEPDGTWVGAFVYFDGGTAAREVHRGTWKRVGDTGIRGEVTTRCGQAGIGWLDGFGEVTCVECAQG